jgi:hypothetical protein
MKGSPVRVRASALLTASWFTTGTTYTHVLVDEVELD